VQRKNTIESFRELCQKHGLAVTHQRQVIFDTLADMEGHPSPEGVYALVKERIPAISLATVYKNLKTFEEYGLIHEVSPHHRSARFETNAAPHHHLVCLRCKVIMDVPADDVAPVRLKKSSPAGFQIQRFNIEMLGLCGKCAKLAEP
jgi:Fur family peroxide stress response transcriptional regulator